MQLLPQFKAQLFNAPDIGEVSRAVNRVADGCGELGTSHSKATLLTREGVAKVACALLR
jgi:hypothetical protein